VTSYVMLPGIYNSGPTHWQTLWESDRSFVRFEPPDWDEPVRAEWIAALETAVASAPEPPVLVAHSLSCLLVPTWAAESDTPVAGAFLVTPVDPAAPVFPERPTSSGTCRADGCVSPRWWSGAWTTTTRMSSQPTVRRRPWGGFRDGGSPGAHQRGQRPRRLAPGTGSVDRLRRGLGWGFTGRRE
jgi:hypothetical protein